MRLAAGSSVRVVAYPPIGGGHVVEWLGRFLFPAGWSTTVRTIGLVTFADVALASQAFLDPQVFIGPRQPAPIRGLLIATVVASAYRLLAPYVRASRAAIVLGACAFAFVADGWHLQHYCLDTRAPRPGDLRVEKARPRDGLVVSDEPAPLYLVARRPSYALPERTDYLTGHANRHFDDDVRAWAALLRERGAYALLVQMLLPTTTAADLSRYVDMEPVLRHQNKTLYAVARG